MSKAEKIHKLANAIKDFRGCTSTPLGAVKVNWIRSPRPDRLTKVVKLLGELGCDAGQTKQAVEDILKFKTLDDFNNWIKALHG